MVEHNVCLPYAKQSHNVRPKSLYTIDFESQSMSNPNIKDFWADLCEWTRIERSTYFQKNWKFD